MEPQRPTSDFFSSLRHPETAWRLFLCALFGIALLVRFIVYLDLVERPLGQFDAWPGTEGWFMAHLAMDTVEGERWLMPGPNMILKPEMLAAAPAEFWDHWSGQRLPRGAIAHYMAVVSHALGGGLVLYSLISLLAGSLLPVLVAVAAALLFKDRRAGVLAGVVASSSHTLVTATVFPGPWIWEALLLAGILIQALRLPRCRENIAEWALLAILVGVGFWMRPLFGWGVPLVAAMVCFLRPPNLAPVLVAVLLPIVLLGGALSVRNISVGASVIPSVGQPAWDFFETTNPSARFRPETPRDLTLMESSAGTFRRIIVRSARDQDFRGELGGVLQRKLREWVGGRDEADSLSPSYIRLRLETLRLTTLAPLTAMSLAWGALLFLLVRRRVPTSLALILAVLLIHGLLFRTDGMERTLLHLCGALLAGGALAVAGADLRRGASGHAFLLLVFWSTFGFLLMVDDHSRGSRFRAWEFAQAQRIHLERNERLMARGEEMQYREIRRKELLTIDYWNVIR
ncbi:MAG: hypothetical protein JJU11_11200 [Candidatus Sumerlaeia bacterium]|nr:hypothetical protein [Candidatus Sumerlaeia bacterium]